MPGKVEWIGVRQERKGPVEAQQSVTASIEDGLSGDHPAKAHRQVTLIAHEALAAVANTLDCEPIDPHATRRNIVVSGLDFSKMDDAILQIGAATIQVTGICHPCEQMNQNIGEGARDAMQGHKGGLTARILNSGAISVGDSVRVSE